MLKGDGGRFEKSLHQGAGCHKKRPVIPMGRQDYLFIDALFR